MTHLSLRRPYIDVLLVTNAFSGRKYYTLLGIVGILMPGRRFRDFGFFMLAVNVGSVLPLDALRRQTASAVILIYIVDFRIV